MTHGSVCSGIGGFELAAQWLGWDNKFYCEREPFCQRVLRYYWPDAKAYPDLKTADFSEWRGKIDVFTAGFPCQPFSRAGLRKGTEDDRHLWPYVVRAIQQIRPRWILCENVRGLVNWDEGVVFHQVQADLEAEGYDVLPLLLPAACVNAPHKRERIFFVATNPSNQRLQGWSDSGVLRSAGAECNQRFKDMGSVLLPDWKDFPTVSPICVGDDELSDRLVDITFSMWQREAIKAGGNAVVPRLVYELFSMIEDYEI
ncbi:hypothetical protein GCM10027051_16120 [Niabella terrae]